MNLISPSVPEASKHTASMECAPSGGPAQAAVLTEARALRSSNSTGLRYPKAEWRRRRL